jgi:hypothetical protein
VRSRRSWSYGERSDDQRFFINSGSASPFLIAGAAAVGVLTVSLVA